MMTDFLISHWLAILLGGVVVFLLMGFSALAAIAAVWRKSDETHSD